MNKSFTIKQLSGIMILSIIFSSVIAEKARADENPHKKQNRVIVLKKDNISISSNRNEFPFDLKYEGIIEISDDDQMINSISPGGFVEINLTSFGNNRRLFIHSDKNGALTYEYYVGKSETSFNPEGKKWLAEILPDIVKNSDLGIESRIRRIYDKKGLSAVLEEIDRNTSSSRTYSYKWSIFSIETTKNSPVSGNTALKTLILDNRLKSQDLPTLIERIGKIRSNSTKGTLLRHILENYELNKNQQATLLQATSTHEYNTERGSTLRMFNQFYSDDFMIRKSYFNIIEDMEINSEKGNVLKDLIERKALSKESWISLLDVVSDFSSEREKGALLLYCLPYLPKDEYVMSEFRNTIDDMSDSYYVLKSEITTAMLETTIPGNLQKPDKNALLSYLHTAENISSNSQRGQILRKANRLFINDDEVVDAYFAVLNSMDSEMEQYNAMLDLLNKNKLNENAIYRLLRETSRLVPDFQHGAGAVLRQVIQQFPLSDNNYDQFFQVIERMDQNATIEELLRMIIDHPSINDKILIKVMECSQRIEVDIEKASLLVRLSSHLTEKNSSLKYIFKSVTNELDSEYEKNRVLKTIH